MRGGDVRIVANIGPKATSSLAVPAPSSSPAPHDTIPHCQPVAGWLEHEYAPEDPVDDFISPDHQNRAYRAAL